jgi:hypothetical protein
MLDQERDIHDPQLRGWTCLRSSGSFTDRWIAVGHAPFHAPALHKVPPSRADPPSREKAASLFEDRPQRTLCLELADGYERLAIQIEQLANQRDGKCPANDR